MKFIIQYKNQYIKVEANENCNIGYPIKYCPVCGAKLE